MVSERVTLCQHRLLCPRSAACPVAVCIACPVSYSLTKWPQTKRINFSPMISQPPNDFDGCRFTLSEERELVSLAGTTYVFNSRSSTVGGGSFRGGTSGGNCRRYFIGFQSNFMMSVVCVAFWIETGSPREATERTGRYYKLLADDRDTDPLWIWRHWRRLEMEEIVRKGDYLDHQMDQIQIETSAVAPLGGQHR